MDKIAIREAKLEDMEAMASLMCKSKSWWSLYTRQLLALQAGLFIACMTVAWDSIILAVSIYLFCQILLTLHFRHLVGLSKQRDADTLALLKFSQIYRDFSRFCVAEEKIDGSFPKIVGLIGVLLHRTNKSEQMGDSPNANPYIKKNKKVFFEESFSHVIEVKCISVLSRYRKTNLPHRLFNEVYRYLEELRGRDKVVSKIEAFVNREEKNARKAFEREGFKKRQECDKWLFGFFKTHTLLHYEKFVGALYSKPQD